MTRAVSDYRLDSVIHRNSILLDIFSVLTDPISSFSEELLCEIRALYSARSSKPDRCQYSRQTSFRARYYLLFPKIGRKSGYFGRIDLNGRPYLKQYILFSNISNSQLEIYARNTNVRPHPRPCATVGRLTLVPGGSRLRRDRLSRRRQPSTDAYRTPGFSERSSLPVGAARSGTNGAHWGLRPRAVMLFRLRDCVARNGRRTWSSQTAYSSSSICAYRPFR